MRNVEDRAAEGSPPDDGAGAVYTSTGSPRARRRRQAIAGGAGLAAAVGVGAILVTLHHDDGRPPVTTVGAPPGVQRAEQTDPTDSPAASPAPSVRSSTAAGAPRARTPRSPEPSLPEEIVKRIKAAREAGKKDSVPIMRPVPQATADVADLKVVESGSLRKDKQTLRLVSGRGDLTDHRELAWVADGGTPVGDASCSQTFKLANEAKPDKKPNLLVCWRTSAAKSVYTVAVDLDGDPSEAKSVAAIEAEWKRLG